MKCRGMQPLRLWDDTHCIQQLWHTRRAPCNQLGAWWKGCASHCCSCRMIFSCPTTPARPPARFTRTSMRRMTASSRSMLPSQSCRFHRPHKSPSRLASVCTGDSTTAAVAGGRADYVPSSLVKAAAGDGRCHRLLRLAIEVDGQRHIAAATCDNDTPRWRGQPRWPRRQRGR